MVIRDYNPEPVKIFRADNSELFSSIPITDNCKRVENVSGEDYVSLEWLSSEFVEIPAGAYIVVLGSRFELMEPYRPTRTDALTYQYTPKFEGMIGRLRKTPFFMYSVDERDNVLQREPSWSLTGNSTDMLRALCEAMKREFGQEWSVVADTSRKEYFELKNTSFSATDIASAANSIGQLFGTEVYLDCIKHIIYFGQLKVERFTQTPTFVGDSIDRNGVVTLGNIGAPRTTDATEGYYNRFYVFGGSRNIEQVYNNTSNNYVVSKRLVLSKERYPNGYIDVNRDGVPTPIPQGDAVFVKVLALDDVFPHADMRIREARGFICYVRDKNNPDELVPKTDASGNPVRDSNGDIVYEQWCKWFVKLETRTGTDANGNPTYTPYVPELENEKLPILMEGKTPKIVFQTGNLTGREFEFQYHAYASTIDNAYLTDAGTATAYFDIEKGDFEIIHTTEASFIIPGIPEGVNPDDTTIVYRRKKEGETYENPPHLGTVPFLDDEVILSDVKMPEEYLISAQADLEYQALKYIKEHHSGYQDTYDFDSNPVEFQKIEDWWDNDGLRPAEKVNVVLEGVTHTTRILSVERSLAAPYKMKISAGEKKAEGRISSLEQQVSALQRASVAGGSGGGSSSGGGGVSESDIRNLLAAYGSNLFLSKANDDSAKGKIQFKKGFTVGTFRPMMGGANLSIDDNGLSTLEVDVLNVRLRAMFEELTTLRASAIAGKQYITAGGSVKVTSVEEFTDCYRCYFSVGEGEERNESMLIAGDYVISKRFSAGGYGYYWRKVKNVEHPKGERYGFVDISKSDGMGDTTPKQGDVLCQFGNGVYNSGGVFPHPERQTAIVLSSVDTYAPSIVMYAGITEPTERLSDKEVLVMGYNNGNAEFSVGNPNNSLGYLKYSQSKGLVIAGDITNEKPKHVYMTLDTNGDTSLAPNETLTVTCRVFAEWKDITRQMTYWNVVRRSENPDQDVLWNHLPKAAAFNDTAKNGSVDCAELKLSLADLDSFNRATFVITAGSSSGTYATAEVEL